MSAVSVLHAEEDARLGERIVGALQRQGHAARRFAGEASGGEDAARIVIWSQAAMRLAALHDQAREALARGALIPVAIGGAAGPAGFEGVTPVDLSGWSGDDNDPRWRFIVDEINIAARRAQMLNAAVAADDATPPRTARAPAPHPAESVAQAELFDAPPAPSLPPSLAGRGGALRDDADAYDEDDPFARELRAMRGARSAQRGRRRREISPLAGVAAAGGAVVAVAALTLFMLLPRAPAEADPARLATAAGPAPAGAAAPPPNLAMIEPVYPQTGDSAVDRAADPAAAMAATSSPASPQTTGVDLESRLTPGESVASATTPRSEAAAPSESVASVAAPDSTPDGAPADELAALIAAHAGDAAPSVEGNADVATGAAAAETAMSEPAAALDEPASMEDLVAGVIAEDAGEASIAATPPTPASVTEAAALGAYFRDCVACPDMALTPAGSFLFGAPPGEPSRHSAEGPQVEVTFSKSFAIATREVTFDQWAACVADGGCAAYEPYDFGWGRGARPVVAVSFEDAQNYVRWLSQKTGRTYRLPTEAEWEYAARAGAATAFSFGDSVSTDLANYNGAYRYRGPVGVNRRRTTPTASFAPNAFGLYDMHGNVWEWTADCWAPDHAGAPATGAGVTGKCSERVVKGGAWNTGGWRLRAAHRIAKAPGARENDIGFRVVRVLP